MDGSLRDRRAPASRPTPIVAGCYVAYSAVGWYLAGLGAILPELEIRIGSVASSYQIFPGAVLLTWGIVVVRRHRRSATQTVHTSVLVAGSAALTCGLVTMGATTWRPVSVIGAIIAAAAATALIRVLPGALATARPADTEQVMIRANAWSSLASISAPIVIGGSIGVGLGWLPGMLAPIALGAAAVARLARPGRAPRPLHRSGSAQAVPALATWWREWSVLAMCIVVEFCFAYYAATYLYEEVGLSTAWAAAGAAVWGIGMTIGRFALSTRTSSPHQFPISLGAIFAGFVLMWGAPFAVTSVLGIGLAGLGAAPLYPMRMTALLRRFPTSPDQASARGSIASGAALLVAPALMVSLRAIADVRAAYLAVPVLLVVLMLLTSDERRRPTQSIGTGSISSDGSKPSTEP